MAKVREVQAALAEAEEECESQRQGRAAAEKQRKGLAKEMDELSARLDEAGGASAAQLEVNRRREAEVAKLRQDLEAANGQHEMAVAALKRKQAEVASEFGVQLEQLRRAKAG